MLKWIKKLFGVEKSEPLVLTDPVKYEHEVIVTERPAEPTPTKPAKEKKAVKKKSVDLDSMSKSELLEHAKKNKIKANASMKKAEILAAIKNG